MAAPEYEFTSKEKYHFNRINDFFLPLDRDKINKMIDIIDGKSNISLRLLDWFVTNYSRQNNIGYFIESHGEKDYFNVNINYKAQLKSYKKVYFDPFRRTKRFNYKYDPNDSTKKLETTICQLNFFKWAISHGIIDYVESNFVDINESMVQNKRSTRERRNSDDTYSTVDTKEIPKKKKKIPQSKNNHGHEDFAVDFN